MAGSGRPRSGILMILLAVFVILALLAAVFFYKDALFPPADEGGGGLALPAPAQSMDKIVVLAQPISRGAKIGPEVLTTVSYPKEEIVEGLFYVDPSSVVGKIAKFDLLQGTPLTPGLISDASTGSLASANIPRNMVAISIPMTRLSSVAYALQPGDHVNVLASVLMIDVDPVFQTRLQNKTGEVTVSSAGDSATGGPLVSSLTLRVEGQTLGRVELDPSLNQPIYMLPSEEQRPRLVTQTVVQNAAVLWVGEYPADETSGAAPTPTPAPAEGTAPQPSRPDIISLIVSPQDAVTLNYLMLSGANLNLVLRGSGDEDINQTEAVTLQFLLDQYRMPFPTKLPYATEPRIDLLPATLPTAVEEVTP